MKADSCFALLVGALAAIVMQHPKVTEYMDTHCWNLSSHSHPEYNRACAVVAEFSQLSHKECFMTFWNGEHVFTGL